MPGATVQVSERGKARSAGETVDVRLEAGWWEGGVSSSCGEDEAVEIQVGTSKHKVKLADVRTRVSWTWQNGQWAPCAPAGEHPCGSPMLCTNALQLHTSNATPILQAPNIVSVSLLFDSGAGVVQGAEGAPQAGPPRAPPRRTLE